MSEKLSEAVVEVAEEEGMNTESKTFEDIHDKVELVEKTIKTIANCDHEEVDVTIPPSMNEESASGFLFDKHEVSKIRGVEEGTKSALRGKCIDCGKDIDVSLNLEIHKDA